MLMLLTKAQRNWHNKHLYGVHGVRRNDALCNSGAVQKGKHRLVIHWRLPFNSFLCVCSENSSYQICKTYQWKSCFKSTTDSLRHNRVGSDVRDTVNSLSLPRTVWIVQWKCPRKWNRQCSASRWSMWPARNAVLAPSTGRWCIRSELRLINHHPGFQSIHYPTTQWSCRIKKR